MVKALSKVKEVQDYSVTRKRGRPKKQKGRAKDRDEEEDIIEAKKEKKNGREKRKECINEKGKAQKEGM